MRITWGAKALFVVAGVMCAAAIGIALMAAAMGRSDIILIAAIFALGLGQLAALAFGQMERGSEQMRHLSADMAALERRVAILTEIRMPMQAPARAEPRPAADKPEIEASEKKQEQLDFYLEPVVDLSNGRTAHYRASVMLRMADGTRFGMESVQRGANQAGVTPLLETLTLARALPALRMLQARGRTAMIFAPASAESFAANDFLARVEEILQAGDEIAACVVLEVSEAELAALSDEGMQGVTRLADKGIHFCLSTASGFGPAPATLASLGFRFVMAEAELLKSNVYNEFAHACLDAGIEIVAAHVDTRDQLAMLQGYTSLGYGALFAPPRLVRDQRNQEGAVAA